MVIFFAGKAYPLLMMALRTRSRDSLTVVSGSPTITSPGRTKKVKPTAASDSAIAPTSRPRRNPSLRSERAVGASPVVRRHCGCTGRASTGGRGCQAAGPGGTAATGSDAADSSMACSSSWIRRADAGRSAARLARQRATSARNASGGSGRPDTGGAELHTRLAKGEKPNRKRMAEVLRSTVDGLVDPQKFRSGGGRRKLAQGGGAG